MFARTPRLTLRPRWPEDAPALAAAIGSGEALLEPVHGADPHPTDARFLIWAHGSGAPLLIGGVALTPERDVHRLSYWLIPDARGQGYATEAARAVVDIARHALPIERLIASHHSDDPAAGRVLRKLGFRETGIGRQTPLADRVDPHTRAYALDLAPPCRRIPLAA